MLIFRVPVWRNVTSYQHPVAHHVAASGLFWVSRKHSRLVFVAVAHPVKLFNWGERSLTPGFRSRRMIHFDHEHDCNPGLSPRLAIVRNGRGLIYGQLRRKSIALLDLHSISDTASLYPELPRSLPSTPA